MAKKTIIKSRKAIFVISILFLLALLMLPSVHSALTDKLVVYYNFSETSGTTVHDTMGYDNAIAGNAAVLNKPGKIGKGAYPANAYGILTNTSINTKTKFKGPTFSFCYWANSSYANNYDTFATFGGSSCGDTMVWRFWTTASSATNLHTASTSNIQSSDFYTSQNWVYTCITRNATNNKIYINAVQKNNSAQTYTIPGGASCKLSIGYDVDNANRILDGYIDEFGWWNRTLTQAEITQLYNSGYGLTYPFTTTPPPSNLTISAYNAYLSSKINTFNATIRNGTKEYNFTTTTGIIYANPFKTTQAKPKVNVTIKAPNFYDRQLLNYNLTTGNINQSMIQAVINMQTKIKVLNTVLTGVTYRINNGATIYNDMIYISAGKYNITFVKANWYNKTQEFTVVAKTNTTRNITGAYDTKLNITARAGNTAGTITGVTYNVSWTALSYSEQTTSSGISSQFNVLSSSASSGIYRIEAKKPGSYIQNNKSYTATQGFKTTNISLYQWNTFNMTTIDEETLSIIKNTTATIYGISSAYNKTVTMEYGKGNLSLLVPDLYSFIYKDKFGKYTERFRYITMVNGTYNNIGLYLLNASKGTAITVTLLDQVGNKLSDYVIVAEKFIPASYQYIPVQSELTSVDGLSAFNILTGNTQYRWKVVKNNVLLYTENLSKIFSTTKTIKLTVGSTFNSGQEALSTWQLATSLVNKSNLMNLTWVSLQGTTGTICMNVSWQNTSSTPRININGQCSSASSGSLTYNYSAYKTGTITAISWIKGSTNILDVYNVILGTGIKLWNIIGNDGWLVYMILMIVGACFMITNITAMPMVLAIIHFACWGMGLIPINVGVTGLAVIVVLILISLRLEK